VRPVFPEAFFWTTTDLERLRALILPTATTFLVARWTQSGQRRRLRSWWKVDSWFNHRALWTIVKWLKNGVFALSVGRPWSPVGNHGSREGLFEISWRSRSESHLAQWRWQNDLISWKKVSKTNRLPSSSRKRVTESR